LFTAGVHVTAWNSPEELAALLAEFIKYYNDCPHQGAELDGLSPNEIARRCPRLFNVLGYTAQIDSKSIALTGF
jgi:hypothetical protein